jgi:hypothetical protein
MPACPAKKEMPMVEYFNETRKKYHHPLVLRLRSDYVNSALGNPENVRQGVDKLLGYLGYRTGIPAPVCDLLSVADDGPAFALGYADADKPFFVVQGTQDPGMALARLTLAVKTVPSTIFGMEQAIRWVELTKFQPYVDASERAAAALGDPTGCESLAKILVRLIEERLPLTDVNTILETVAAAKSAAGDDALGEIAESVRVAMREDSAKYYLDYYGVHDVYRAGAELASALGSSDSLEAAKDAICRVTAGLDTTFALLVDQADLRRKLWQITEGLFTENRLNRPAVVLSAAEVPAQVALPESRGEIRLSAAQGI